MKHLLLYILALLFATMQTFAQTYTYDSNNRLTEVKYGNGIKVVYTYDAVGNRLTKKVTGATAETFTITTVVSPSGSGTVTGGGTYSDGTIVELHAIANAGYEFLKWNDNVTDNPRTIKVTKDQAFTALFTESSTPPDLAGDLNADGKVDRQDINMLVNAYLLGANATNITDMDGDGMLSIADVARQVSIVNGTSTSLNSNGHQYVDLGLPSGTLWATCNVGASSPEESGNFYAWGETATKDDYTWSTYKWCDGDECTYTNRTLTKYCDRGGYGIIDGKITLELEDDAAHVNWGGDWHIPTTEQFQELMDHCTVERIEMENTGKSGYKFTSTNGNSIILPYAGRRRDGSTSSSQFYYWSTDLYMTTEAANNHCDDVLCLRPADSEATKLSTADRYYGLAVRPVLSEYTPVTKKVLNAPSNHMGHNLVDLGLPSGTLWASCNMGASSPEQYGCYYAWGETSGSCEGKTAFGISNYPVDYSETVEQGENLPLNRDASHVNWGGEWHMPTLTEVKELMRKYYTTCEWTTENGVNGYRITSHVRGFEGNSIFLPAAGYYDSNVRNAGVRGYYWSSTLYNNHDVANNVGYMYFYSDKIDWWEEEPWYGLTIRPVVSLDAIVK